MNGRAQAFVEQSQENSNHSAQQTQIMENRGIQQLVADKILQNQIGGYRPYMTVLPRPIMQSPRGYSHGTSHLAPTNPAISNLGPCRTVALSRMVKLLLIAIVELG
jgi:hypothetical protein